MEERRPYPSDVTDAQWAILEPLIARPRRADGRGRPPEVELREVVNAILYVLREGCRWRALPHDFPNFNTVYWYFAKWTDDGTLVRIHDALRRRTREHSGREPDPSALIIDSQSVKATEKGGCRLRRRHAGEGDEALHRRRYERAAAAGGRLECEGAGLGWPAGPVRGGAAGQPARDRRLGRRRLRRRRGRGTGALRVGARGRAEADRPARLRRPAASLGGGAHVRLADRLPPAHQGLRSLRRDERGFHLSGDDPPHAPPPRPRRRPTTLEDRSRRLIHSQTRSEGTGSAQAFGRCRDYSRTVGPRSPLVPSSDRPRREARPRTRPPGSRRRREPRRGRGLARRMRTLAAQPLRHPPHASGAVTVP